MKFREKKWNAILSKLGLVQTSSLEVTAIFRAKIMFLCFRLCRPGSIIGPQQHFLEE